MGTVARLQRWRLFTGKTFTGTSGGVTINPYRVRDSAGTFTVARRTGATYTVQLEGRPDTNSGWVILAVLDSVADGDANGVSTTQCDIFPYMRANVTAQGGGGSLDAWVVE